MTNEDLMKQRYKVIADWPGNYDIEEGSILDGNVAEITPLMFRMDAYPHLFKKLEWWEERKPEEMPAYVKQEDDCIKKARYFLDEGRMRMILNDEDRGWLVSENVMPFFKPATEEEYLSQSK